MATVLSVVLLLLAGDLCACGLLLAVVWYQYRLLGGQAGTGDQAGSDAQGQLGCLLAGCLLGAMALVLLAWRVWSIT